MSYEKVYIILSLILVQLERVYANQTSDAMSDLALANGIGASGRRRGRSPPAGGGKFCPPPTWEGPAAPLF